MRIEEIRVDGYGTLADVNIRELPVGLTIISGDNEAGKSTLLDFVRGVLFGFPNRNRRLAYHVPLRGGRHGGAVGLVDEDGARWHLERHVGAGDALLTTADGLPASHEILQKILGNADDALFRNVFAFGLSELSLFDSLDREEVRDIVFSAGVLGAGRSARRATAELEALRMALVRPRKGRPMTRVTPSSIERPISARLAKLVRDTSSAWQSTPSISRLSRLPRSSCKRSLDTSDTGPLEQSHSLSPRR